MTPILRLTLPAALASLALAGCLRAPLETGSLKDSGGDRPARSAAATTSASAEKAAAVTPALKPTVATPAATEAPAAAPPKEAAAPPSAEEVTATTILEEKKTADDDLREWCGQRFIDYQNGKRPGGARTVEQKQADDRLCEALRRD